MLREVERCERYPFFSSASTPLWSAQATPFSQMISDVLRCSDVEGLLKDLRLAAHSDHNDGDIAQYLQSPNATARLDSADLRHPHLHHD
jgi:hypothetical protein